MPSQISLRTSPVQVGQRVGCSCGDDDMKAAARTVGSLLAAHSTAVRKPPRCDVASVNCNGCGKSGSSSTALTMIGHSTETATAANPEPKHGRVNGMVETQSLHVTPPPCRTCGESSDSKSMDSLNHSNRDWLMCPELAIGYTGSLMKKRMASLATKQKDLEHKISLLHRKVRLRQLNVVHSHACKQLSFDSDEQGSFSIGQSSLNGSSSSVDSHPLERREVLPLPIQVDGASDDTFFLTRQVRGKEQSPELDKVEQWQRHDLEEEEEEESFPDGVGEDRPVGMHVERLRNQDSSSSLDSSYMSSVCSEGEESGVRSVRAQLTALQTQLDPDLTDASSDEEGEESADPMHWHDLRNVWDDTRLALGSRWVWLQRRIAELNKQIYRLDHHMKECFSRRDKLAFSQPSPSKPILPPYFSITNGSMLEHLRTTNGAGGLIAMGKAMGTGTKPSGNNGFSHYSPHPATTGHAHCLPQLLLPEALLGAKLQVKDLLSPSHVERNILYVDETSCTAARTRALLHRPNRRVVRKKAAPRLRAASHHTADMAFHPQLSMAHELPSRIPLDCALKQVLSEHSYAQLPPLRKRRKAASFLPHLSTSLSQDSEHYHSASPSPVHTPHSLDSTREWSAHKKNSLDSSLGSPWSPGLSHSLTPGFTTPLQSNRKKRVTNSTPLFDIDNIVIPYSMAASTRLEKLEYKEILTPSWREVTGHVGTADPMQKQNGEASRRSPSVGSDTFTHPGMGESEEDVTDQAFKARHNRCELIEKKRFLNFISGGQRKRARPQSMTLSENGGPVTSPPLPPRRLTVASPSPSHAEPEVVSNMLHVVVLPWHPREFPLSEADQQALVNPPPPPPTITRPASPSPHTPSQTPSHASSAVPTPAASPRSTPSEGTPAMSPAEWAVVNTNFPPTLPPSSAMSNPCPSSHADSAFLSSPHTPLILKLTKKTC